MGLPTKAIIIYIIKKTGHYYHKNKPSNKLLLIKLDKYSI